MLGLGRAVRLAEGLVVLVEQMGEESTVPVVLWVGAAHKGMGAVERGLRPCFPFHVTVQS